MIIIIFIVNKGFNFDKPYIRYYMYKTTFSLKITEDILNFSITCKLYFCI